MRGYPSKVTVTTAILAVALLTAAAIAAASLAGASRPSDPTDIEVPDGWLVLAVSRWPSLQDIARSVDRRVWGGIGLAVTFVILLSAALLVGWIFGTIDSGRGVARWDESVAQWGSDHADGSSLTVVRAVTELGGTPTLVVLMTVVGVVEWRRRGDATSLWFLLAVIVGVVAVNNALKLAIMRERPPVEHLMEAAGSSFPSGHSAAAAACWPALALVVGRRVPGAVRPWLAAVAVGVAVAVAASRALLGVHWLSDVVAGLLVGGAWFSLVALAFGGRLQRFGEPVERMESDDIRRRAEAHHGQ
jgi:membrane-associated phospholipid phosphatase